jgi:WD40 repeat protein
MAHQLPGNEVPQELKRRQPKPVTVLRGHVSEVNCLCFGWADTGAQLLVSGDAAGTLIIWELAMRRPRLRLEHAHPGGVLSVSICPGEGGTTMFSQGRDNSVRVWDLVSLDYL